MADDKTFTKADLDAAVKEAIDKVQENLDKLEAKNQGLLDDLKKAQREARAAKDIKPEDLAAAEERAEKAETALNEASKQVKALTGERDKAAKALETETAAARNYALEAEIGAGIAEGGVVPALTNAYRAYLKEQKPEVDIVDGKFIAKLGGKPAREFIKEHLAGEEGKAFRAAAINGGGGAPGSGDGASGGKTVTRTQFDGMDQFSRVSFAKEGGKVVDQV